MTETTDIIDPQTAGTLPGLFRERVRRTPQACAYRRFTAEERCWRASSRGEGPPVAGPCQGAAPRGWPPAGAPGAGLGERPA